MESEVTRRGFVKATLAASGTAAAAVGLGGAMAGAAAAEEPPAATPPAAPPAPPAQQAALPQGKIKDLSISRLLLGGNLLTHYTHSRDLRYVYDLAKHYNTREKIIETMALAEANGINTVVLQGITDVLKEYREKRGGKIQCIYGPIAPVDDGLVQYGKAVEDVIDAGVDAIYFWGVHADGLVPQGKVDVIAKAVEMAKSYGVPSGVAAHNSEVIVACEKNKVGADFYIKTLHHHNYPSATLNFDSMWCSNPEETAEIMKGVDKPWIAFKVMAAGAIPPADAFPYSYKNGADFILAGMFDFEVAEDARIAREALAGLKDRARPWRA